MAPHNDDVVTRAKRKVQRQIEDQERDRKNKLLKRRIEIAVTGVKAQEAGKTMEAMGHYMNYLHLLEDWKGVKSGGLTPTHFDKSKDLYELLLISGMFWDLAKIFDRMKSPDKKKQFLHYLEKYVQFSKGMPFQPLCKETLRKYVQNDKGIHHLEFKNAYKQLGGSDSNCFIATALMEEVQPQTIPSLRSYRDKYLLKTARGRAFIAIYYRLGPPLAVVIERLPHSIRVQLAKVIDAIAGLVKNRTDS